MCTSSTTQLQEALTIPPNKDDKHEVELRAKMPKSYVHGDRVIRWYRNAKKGGAADEELSRWVDNFANVEDLLKTYDEYIKKLGTMKMLDKKVKIDFNGKQIEVDPVKDVDKIRRLKGFVALVKALGDIIHSGSTIHTTSQKYALDDKDRKLIKLISYTSNVMVWQTQQYATTNKFIYQLWQNAETLGRGDVYGDPSDQTPYCTHSIQHWNEYSDGDPEYTQYWFLRTLPDAKPSSTGDLDNADVVKVFNSMQNAGQYILIAMDDSGGDFLDRDDDHVDNDYSNIDRDVRSDVIQLRKKLPYFVKMSDRLLKMFKDCVNDDNELDLHKFKTDVTQLAQQITGKVWTFYDQSWFDKLHIKKINIENMAPYQLNAVVRTMKIKKLPVISFKDRSIGSLLGLFEQCDDIEEVMGFENTNMIYNAAQLFKDCINLKVVHSISFPGAEECQSMFYGCKKLKYIGSISVPNCKYAAGMLDDCVALAHINSMDVGKVHGMQCPVDIDDAEYGIKEVLPSADKHTQELIAHIISTSLSHEKEHKLRIMQKNIDAYNYQLANDYRFNDGTVKCNSNDEFWSVLRTMYTYYPNRLSPSDNISFLKDMTQKVIRAYYAEKKTPLPLQVKCIDLTNDKDILKNKSFPYIDDTYVEIAHNVTMSLPSIKITAEQAKYKDTIFNGHPMSKYETNDLRAKYGDKGEKIDWIIVDDMTKESAQIRAELNNFRRLFF